MSANASADQLGQCLRDLQRQYSRHTELRFRLYQLAHSLTLTPGATAGTLCIAEQIQQILREDVQ